MRREEASPRTIREEPGGSLFIEWSDGHQTSLTPARLRAGCPCAACREARLAGGEGEPSPASAGSIRIIRLQGVGRYGLAPVWSDGHAAGIYSWPVLRDLCDCLSCRWERGMP